MDLTVTRNSDRSSDYSSSKNMACLFEKKTSDKLNTMYHTYQKQNKTKTKNKNKTKTIDYRLDMLTVVIFRYLKSHIYICINAYRYFLDVVFVNEYL